MNDPTKICPQCSEPLTSEAPGGLCPRCVMKMNLLSDTLPGTPGATPTVADLAPHFPQLEILECLGRGGMGIVYKARQPQLDRLVALKILAPERVDDVRFAERFRREGVSLARLDHPNIVTVFDTGEAGGFYYLLMEFVDGLNLREAIAGEKMPAREALAIVPLICAGLQYAHEQGVVHRDIKPENILLDKKGRVKIADFGVAKLVCGPEDAADGTAAADNYDPGLTLDGKLGTPQYMAPEQEDKSGLADHRSDIYALGVVFYEMLTGERPAKDVIAPSRKVQIDVRIDEIVLRALEKEPAKRYQTAGEFGTVVETVATSARGSEDSVQDPFSSRNLRNRKGSAPSRPAMELRFSRLAMVGACSAMVLPLGLALNQFVAITTAGTDGVWSIVAGAPGMPMMALGLAAMIGTTILGWIAVSQIRRSAGRLYGLELAVFDGLLVPGLMLIALGWVLWYSLLDWAFPLLQMLGIHKPSAAFSLIVWIPWLAISIWLGIWATRKTWHMLTQPAKGETQSISPPGTHVGIAKTPRKDRMVLAGVGISVAVLMTLLSLFFWIQRPRMIDQYGVSADSPDGMFSADGYTWHEMRVFGGDRSFYRFVVQGRGGAVSERWEVPVPSDKLATGYVLLSIDEILFGKHGSIVWSEDSKRVSFRVNGIEVSGFDVTDRSHPSPAVPSGSKTSATPTFGSVREVRLNDCDVKAEALDFETGRVLAVPEEVQQQLKANNTDWFVKSGAELLTDSTSKGVGLITIRSNDLTLVKLATEEWQSLTPGQLSEALKRDSSGLNEEEMNFGKVYVLSATTPAPVTLGFRTSSGTEGVLQASWPEEVEQKTVTLRYKLVAGAKGSPLVTMSSKRQRFVPEPGLVDRTSWAVFDKPSFLNSNGWAVMSRMMIGGVAKIKLPGEVERRCDIELLKGDDASVTIQIHDLARNSVMTLPLLRDQKGEITVDGAGYRVTYLSVFVANDEPDTSAFAQVVVTPVDQSASKSEPASSPDPSRELSSAPLPGSAPKAKESLPAFGSGDSVLIWHWDMATKPLTVYIMEDRIFHDPAPLLARLAGLYRQKPFSAVPVRLGPAGWAETDGRKVVRELENALRGSCPARLTVGEVLAELPLEMDDGLYSVTVPAWDINKNSALDLDHGTLNQTKPPLSLDFSKPETLKAWRGMGFDAYVLPGSNMLMLPTLPAVLVPAADEWEQSEIAPRALMQKIASLAGRDREQKDSEERPVIALFADDPKGGWLLTDYGSLLLVKVEKDGDDPGALKVSWRRARQARLRGEASSPQTTETNGRVESR